MAFDWTAERVKAKWVFREVGFPSYDEMQDYDFIKGGTGELSALSDMKMTGTLDIDGGLPNELNLLRVYHSCENVLGEKSGEICVATYVVSVPEPIHRASTEGERISGSIKCTSVLSILHDKMLHAPLVLPKGTDALGICKGLIDECHIPYVADETEYVTGRDREYAECQTYLDVINDLLDLANFRAIYPDAYGVLHMEKYVSPFNENIVPVFEFVRGETAIHMREIPFSMNYRDTPTTMVGHYSTENYKIISVAKNVNPDSPSSTVNRGGREKDEEYLIEELTETTQEGQIEEVARETLSALRANSSDIRKMQIDHLFVPMVRPNKVINISDQNIDFRGAVTSISMKYSTDSMCTTQSRMITKYELSVENGTATQETEFYGEFVLPEESESE